MQPQYPRYPQHPYARYPYAYQPPAQGYVGPAWAAPMPYRQLPPRRSSGMSGCAIAALVVFLLAVGGFGLLGLVVVLVVRDAGSASGSSSWTTPTAEPTIAPTATTVTKGGLPARTAVDSHLFDSAARADYTGGACVEPKWVPEEARNYYSLYYKGHGTAKNLRGRTALVHLRIMSPSAVWTMRQSSDVDRAALLAAHFFRDQARAYAVSDLDYVPMTWSLSTDYVPPRLLADRTNKISNAASRQLVSDALAASEASIGQTTESIATQLQGEGYENVAFLLHLPIKNVAREFAFPAPLRGRVDVAVVFEHPDLAHLAFTTTHESLHLFGADDIYPITDRSIGDEKDMMRDYCLGFGDARIGDMTAYAIGWTNVLPSRPYTIR